MIYFGTDGIRGIANKELTPKLCFKCGLALTKIVHKPKILIATDTRKSKDLIVFSFLSGVLSGGGEVLDIGIAPTSAVSFLLTKFNFDFGVVISASHNPKEYNGIKIFSSCGEKISEKLESEIENYIITPQSIEGNYGIYTKNIKLLKLYEEYLCSNVNARFNGLKVVLDMSNGASFKVAPKIFKKLGAEVISINAGSGEINENCGSLFLDGLKQKVLEVKADVGIAFDGDADRIICVDSLGNVVDGDNIIYILAKYLKKKNLLKNNVVVGTSQTNLKIEKRLKNLGINFIRSDVGDKFVIEKMNEFGAVLGGEQSGHIIISNILKTGDGILAGLKLLEILISENKSLKRLNNIRLMPQILTNIKVKDKLRIKNSEELNNLIINLQQNFDGRIIVRCSGTEEKIRVLVEGKSKKLIKQITNEIVKLINKLNI